MKIFKTFIIGVLVLAIIILLMSTVFFVYLNFKALQGGTNIINDSTNNNTATEEEEVATDENSQSLPEIKLHENIEVDWLAEKQKVNFLDFFDSSLLLDRAKADPVLWSEFQKGYYDSGSNYYENMANYASLYKTGNISSGALNGSEVFYLSVPPQTLGYTSYYRFIKKSDGQIILLTNNSSGWPYSPDKVIFDAVTDSIITNNNTPDYLIVPKGNYKLVKRDVEPFKFYEDYADITFAYKTHDGLDIYRDHQTDCFVVFAPDGTAREYLFDLPFVSSREAPSQYGGAIPVTLDIKFDNGTTVDHEYIFQNLGGCGTLGSCYRYADYITDPAKQLKKVGTTANGDPIYEVADMTLKERETDKQGVLDTMYQFYYPGFADGQMLEKISFEEFLQGRPLLLWQDPFGDFLEIRRLDYLPAVECGKPVIYLYPEQTTDVSVQVAPTGGLTVTEPDYGTGWQVSATADGQIYNYADQKNYPYLFWEGLGLNYDLPEEGFVVARQDIPRFLTDTLAKLGLNSKETADFLEYWAPKLTAYPYYFITFVGQQEFDQLAPLTVSPKPDTIIRVFMDYYGLLKPFTPQPLEIFTPVRNGFTVVEWGGALR